MGKPLIVMFEGKFWAIDANVLAVGDAKDVKAELDNLAQVALTVLPHEQLGPAAFARMEERRFFLMYAPAQRRQLLWKNKQTQELKRYIVWFPHLYIGLFFRKGAIENGYAMVASKPIKKAEDLIGRLPLPNTSGQYGHICEGHQAWNIKADSAETSMSYIKYFLDSEFISDINDHWQFVPKALWPPNWDLTRKIYDEYHEQVNQEILANWQSLSETNLDMIKGLEWGAAFSLKDLVHANWDKEAGPGQMDSILGNLQPLQAGQMFVAAGPPQ
jgi:hypothetical protein